MQPRITKTAAGAIPGSWKRFVRSGAIFTAMEALPIAYATPRRIKRAEYDRLAELGFFRDERVELIRGIVIEMAPIGPPHSEIVDTLMERLVRGLEGRARVRIQHPFLAGDDSEPEPDVAVVPLGRYADKHPDQAFLIIEVADSSLKYDRETKSGLYALSGVPEYWVVDVAGQTVDVYTEPAGGQYHRTQRVEANGGLRPTAFPDVAIAVRDLFG
jgi:Uma2 family endonuclease